MALGLAVLGAAPAQAAEFAATMVGTALADDNLFRRSLAGRQATAHDGRDLVGSITGRLSATGRFGAASWSAHAGAAHTVFRNNDYLDNSSVDVGGKADYAARGGDLSLTAGLVRQLIPFEDNRLAVRGIQTVWRARAEGSRTLLGDLRVVAGGGYTRSTNSDARLGLGAYRRYDVSAGLGYYSTAGNILAIQGRMTGSTGLNDRSAVIGGVPLLYRADSLDRTIEARLLYHPSTLVTIDGRLGYTRHRDDSVLSSDFSGPTGNVVVSWTPLPTIDVKLRAERMLQTQSAAFANGISVNHVRFELAASPVDRVSLTLAADRRWRTFRYDLLSPLAIGGRRERLTELSGQAVFAATKRITVSGNVSRGWRHSTLAAFDYRDTQATIGIALIFGSTAAAGS